MEIRNQATGIREQARPRQLLVLEAESGGWLSGGGKRVADSG